MSSSSTQDTDQPLFQLFTSLRHDPQLLDCEINAQYGGPSPFYMLSLHRDRMLLAAEHFRWDIAVARISGETGLTYIRKHLEERLDGNSSQPLRVKLLLDSQGRLAVESNATPHVPLSNLYPDQLPTPLSPQINVHGLPEETTTSCASGSIRGGQRSGPGWTILLDTVKTDPSPYTTYKTTTRSMYDAARQRVGIESMTEPREVLLYSSTKDEIMEGSLTTITLFRNGRWVTPPISSGGQAGTTRRFLLERGLCVEERIHRTDVVDGEECWISNGVRGFVWGRVRL